MERGEVESAECTYVHARLHASVDPNVLTVAGLGEVHAAADVETLRVRAQVERDDHRREVWGEGDEAGLLAVVGVLGLY